MILEYAAEALRFRCSHHPFTETVLGMLRPSFRVAREGHPAVAGTVEVRFAQRIAPPPPARPWRAPPRLVINDVNGPAFRVLEHAPGRVSLLREPEEDDAPVRLDVDRARGSWRVTAADDDDASARAVARLVQYFVGCRMVLRGAAVLHASAVERHGRAVLLAGPKGSGKSTLMMQACAHAGARFLSDDLVFLWRAADGGMRCSGWPKRVAVPFTALQGVPLHTRPEAMRSRGSAPGDELRPAPGAVQHRPPAQRERLELDAEAFLRCFGVDAGEAAAPAALVRPRFVAAHEARWSLRPRAARVDATMLQPRHRWLFTDYLCLVPEPAGPRARPVGRHELRQLPAFELRHRGLHPGDVREIWNTLLPGAADEAG